MVCGLGGAIALISIILALGGAKLIGAGGSWYYLFAGLALIVAGLAVAQRKLLGAWIYVGAFLGTALWAFWEVGLNGWALVPRLGGPGRSRRQTALQGSKARREASCRTG